MKKIRNETQKALIACPECDLLHTTPVLDSGDIGRCCRCDAILFRHQLNGLNRPLAFAATGLIFFFLANLFPILIFEMNGNMQVNRLIDGAVEFLDSSYWMLGILVLISSALAPLLVLLFLIGILLPLKLGVAPLWPETQIRMLEHVRPWAMAEIFVLGIMVAFVKLGDFAEVNIGLSMIAFMCMVATTVMAYISLDQDILWERLALVRGQKR
ncbi:paraquat-inducible protein A [Sneathiella sp.]|uniref:paraquat-inducible protein A n=1 Tax=Sneathiella sp. TaxID=1964365 RepID=UPI0039E38DF6